MLFDIRNTDRAEYLAAHELGLHWFSQFCSDDYSVWSANVWSLDDESLHLFVDQVFWLFLCQHEGPLCIESRKELDWFVLWTAAGLMGPGTDWQGQGALMPELSVASRRELVHSIGWTLQNIEGIFV